MNGVGSLIIYLNEGFNLIIQNFYNTLILMKLEFACNG